MNGILSDKSKSLAFTEHRTIPIERQNEIRARLVEAVSLACRSGITCFFSGMAMGFDLMAAETVLSLKGKYPEYTAYCRCSFQKTELPVAFHGKGTLSEYNFQADQVIVLSEHYFHWCLLRRNDFMLEHSCGVIAFYDGKSYGGTSLYLQGGNEERHGHSKSVLKTSPDYTENIVQNIYANFLHISFIMLIFR